MIEGFERIGVHWPSLVAYMVNFAILLGTLYLLAYRPLLKSVLAREERRRLAETVLDEAQRQLADAKSLADRTLSDAKAEVDRIVSSALAHARADAQAEIERRLRLADARIEAHLTVERRRIADESATLAVDAAARILEQALGARTQRALVEASIDEIRRQRLPPPARHRLATVTSAVALTEDEMHAVAEALGAQPAVTVHHVRPEIIGGLAVTVGDTLIDASVLGKLRRLGEELSRADIG